MAFGLTRSMFRPGEVIGKFEDLLKEQPDEVKEILEKTKKSIMPMAMAVKGMSEHAGWREVLGAFLEKNGNPALLFKKRQDIEVGEIKAYYKILCLVNNLSDFADKYKENKEE